MVNSKHKMWELEADGCGIQWFISNFDTFLEQLHFVRGDAIFGATFQKEMMHKQAYAIFERFQLCAGRNPLEYLEKFRI